MDYKLIVTNLDGGNISDIVDYIDPEHELKILSIDTDIDVISIRISADECELKRCCLSIVELLMEYDVRHYSIDIQ
jgi:hypothetical protein